MIRNRLVPPPVVQIVALLALAFIVGTARSADSTDVKVDDAKRVIELLDKIEKRLAVQEARAEVTLDLVTKDIKSLREEVARLQKEVADLRRPAGGTTTSNYQSSASVAAPPQQGRIRIFNNYPTEVTAVVNGTTVPSVAPGRYLDVIVPPGTVTYQIPVLGQPTKTNTVAANEVLTLTLYPL
jgi:hypothetical protein